jgi:molybdate transport system ATP-binding protein
VIESRSYAAVSHRFASSNFELHLALDLIPGWNVLFGPSGSGKTTFLRAATGLLRPDSGLVRVDDEVWFDSERGIFLPPERRNSGYVAQRPALFPHLTVEENVAFGLRLTPADTSHRTAEMMDLFHCSHLASRRPDELSGGEQQRVALARAIARRPKILLLDEPFRGLDFELRDAILSDLESWVAASRTPVLAVSHDVVEICQLGAQVTRIAAGRVVDSGPAATILAPYRERILRRLES